MDRIRWGLLSTARINRRLIPVIRASSRGELAAVASRTKETAEAYARQWEIPHAFGSYQEMLDSGQVDAVYIGLPNHLHAEWTIRALRSGKHVLCEKPFAITLEQVDAMIAASRETGCYLAEAFMYRHHPQTRIVGEWVHSGRLGQVLATRGVFTFSISDESDVRMNPEWGGGCLWDVGVYPLSFSQYIFGGPPETVTAFQKTGASGVDEVFAGQMQYPGGGQAQILASFRVPYHASFEILGTKGRLELTRPFTGMEEGRRLTFISAEGEAQEIPVPDEELYQGEVEDLHSAVLDSSTPYLSLEESCNHVRTVLALYEAAQQGRPVRLE